MEPELTRFMFNGEYYTGEIKMVTPEPEPTPESTPEPEPEPVKVEEPESTSESTPEPTPEPTPESTLESTPEPTAESTLESTPEPTAESTPEPEPTPEPVKVEEPESTPEPEPVKVEEPESTPEPEPIKVEEPTPEVKRNKNELGIDRTTTIRLSKFDIIRARVFPHKSATIDITIYANDKEVERVVLLSGEDYLKWSSDDDYLYDYVRENIEKIYDN